MIATVDYEHAVTDTKATNESNNGVYINTEKIQSKSLRNQLSLELSYRSSGSPRKHSGKSATSTIRRRVTVHANIGSASPSSSKSVSKSTTEPNLKKSSSILKMKLFKNIRKLDLLTSNETDSKKTSSSPPRRRRRLVSTTKDRRKVSFADDFTTEFAASADLSDKEAQWYSKQELNDMLEKLKKEGRRFVFLKNGERPLTEDNDECCFRGLEDRTLEGHKEKRNQREMVWEAVLTCQCTHEVEGCDAGKLIAVASMRNSLMSRQEAVVRANLDELFASEYLADERLLHCGAPQ